MKNSKIITLSIGDYKNIRPIYAAIISKENCQPKAIVRLSKNVRLKKRNSEIIIDDALTEDYLKKGDVIVIAFFNEGGKKEFSGIVDKISCNGCFEIESEGSISTIQ